jgi:hypothetical protein
VTTTAATDVVHACWSFDDYRPFDDYAREFLDAGLAAGEQVWYVSGRPSGATTAWLAGAGAAARIVNPGHAYAAGRTIDPAEQVAAYTAVTEQALAAGFTGFRVAADVTAMVRTQAQREAFARYEYLIGRYLRVAPMRAVCAYDRVELGDRAVAELACLHDTSHRAGVSFQLQPGPTTASAVLYGELDAAGEDLFETALRRTDLASAGGQVTVEASGLRFIDHRALLALQRFAETRKLTAVLRTRLGSAARIAGLLELSDVRVEVTR